MLLNFMFKLMMKFVNTTNNYCNLYRSYKLIDELKLKFIEKCLTQYFV